MEDALVHLQEGADPFPSLFPERREERDLVSARLTLCLSSKEIPLILTDVNLGWAKQGVCNPLKKLKDRSIYLTSACVAPLLSLDS
ncbi:hypothetical protein MHYP_G00230130 [Metynnis hypsauchen]